MEVIIFGLLIFAFYFFPTIVASSRNHHSTGAIFVLNLLLGWTFLFWVLALVRSFTHVVERQPIQRPIREPFRKHVPLLAMILGIIVIGVAGMAFLGRSQKSTSITTASTSPAYTSAAVVGKEAPVPEVNSRLQFVAEPQQVDPADKIKREAERVDFCRAEMEKPTAKRSENTKKLCQVDQQPKRTASAPSAAKQACGNITPEELSIMRRKIEHAERYGLWPNDGVKFMAALCLVEPWQDHCCSWRRWGRHQN